MRLKKIMLVILAAALLLPLISCGGSGEGEETTTAGQPTDTARDTRPDGTTETTETEITETSEAETTETPREIPPVSLEMLPKFDRGSGTSDYDCGDGVYMRYIEGLLQSGFAECLGVLEAEGYTKLSYAEIEKNYFSTYVKDTVQIYAYYCTKEAAARFIISPYGSTADSKINNSYTGTGEVLLTQVGINYKVKENGMSYIIRTPAGSFIVIDGGWGDQGEAEKILNLLKEQNTGGGKPEVAAWILTHPHSDHIGAISEFATLYHDQIELKRIIYNFVNDEVMKASDSKKMITDYNSYYATLRRALSDKSVWGDVIKVKPHTGQTLTFDGVSITITGTHEDVYPALDKLEYMNASSMSFMLETVGNRILFLGDSTGTVTKKLADRYGKWLKCDYLQPTHHGTTGGNLNLYSYASPEVCLWCVPPARFEEYKGSDFNQYLLKNVKTHYFDEGTVTLTISPK
ncbi:MAG: ComEC/Rec2 family competence protein [Eubacteriales bacterium]|jgi:beta-lactamase superfamily II metal-dependent hydrolase